MSVPEQSSSLSQSPWQLANGKAPLGAPSLPTVTSCGYVAVSGVVELFAHDISPSSTYMILLGRSVGDALGSRVVGEILGPFEGEALGFRVGDWLDSDVVGEGVGGGEGGGVGEDVGGGEGLELGSPLGSSVLGTNVGLAVIGLLDGLELGLTVGFFVETTTIGVHFSLCVIACTSCGKWQ